MPVVYDGPFAHLNGLRRRYGEIEMRGSYRVQRARHMEVLPDALKWNAQVEAGAQSETWRICRGGC